MPTTPPTIQALMDDPLYRAYMKRPPRLPQNLRTGEPWRLWVHQGAGRWGTTQRPTYADAWQVFLTHYKAGRDVTIVSKRVFYAPPGEWYRVKVRRARQVPGQATHNIETRWRQLWFSDAIDLHWCGRCRRPVYWMPLFADHHALRKFPAVTDDNNYRCVICGIRWISQPDIRQMVKMEAIPK
jgi:hypothetical protein